MRDASMTLPPFASQLINGRDHELRVVCDRRGKPRNAELVRKRDSQVLARLRFNHVTVIEPTHRARLTGHSTIELSALLARWRHGDFPRDRSPLHQTQHVTRILRQLGVGSDVLAAYRPPPCLEPKRVVLADRDLYGRPLWLTASTARAWLRLRSEARRDGVTLHPVSGYRSVDYQAALVARKLARGQTIETILSVSALPGYSEHHLGTTLDLHDGHGPALEEAFEQSAAFAWLQANGGRCGFRLSFPRDNPWGIAYEPWHWRYDDRRSAR